MYIVPVPSNVGRSKKKGGGGKVGEGVTGATGWNMLVDRSIPDALKVGEERKRY